MRVAEMRIIRWIYGHTRFDSIRNGVIRGKIRVTPIEDKIREAKLRWFGHGRRKSMDASVRRCENINHLDCKRSRGRPKKSRSEVIRHDLKTLGLVDDMARPGKSDPNRMTRTKQPEIRSELI